MSPPYGRGYPAKVRRRACALREAGWTWPRVQELLADEFGVRPSLQTLACWADPRQHELKVARDQRRKLKEATGRRGYAHHSAPIRFRRMQALADAGLSAESIARVIELDYGDRFSWRQVRDALRDGRYPPRAMRSERRSKARPLPVAA